MTQAVYSLMGVTILTAVLVAVLVFALMKFSAAARKTRQHVQPSSTETVLWSVALQEAVTQLKGQEQAMSARAVRSEQLSTQIVESLTAGLLVVDRAGQVEILNPAGARMLSITAVPAGASHRALLADAPELAALIDTSLQSAEAVVRRTLPLHGMSRTSHLGVTISPLGEPTSPRGVICLFSDLTKVMALEEQLRLKEALARLGELTAGIAHEFRNGLATIHGYGRLIDPKAIPPSYAPYIEGIRQETDALGKVVNNFLRFAKPEQVTFSRVALDVLARGVATDLQHELPDGTSVEVTGAFSDIQGDDVLLRQVLDNLIRNAAEACQLAGTTPRIRVVGGVDDVERTCIVSVDDNGPGIPREARARIFQPFFTTRSRGTGLGLAIVQKVVLLHNGHVVVRDSPAGGGSIQMQFPIAETATLPSSAD